MLSVHCYSSPFTHEARILKITKSIIDSKLFNSVAVIADWRPGLLTEEEYAPKSVVYRIPCRFSRSYRSDVLWKTLSLFEWSVKAYRLAVKLNPQCVDCHSVSILPVCAAVKRRIKCKLIYNAHELETETVECRGLRRRPLKHIEKHYIGKCDEIVLVNDSIANWYQNKYKLTQTWTVLNTPLRSSGVRSKTNLLSQKCGIPFEESIFLYQGNLSVGRSIPTLLNVFSRTTRDKHIVFMGKGAYVPEIKEFAANNPNIHYQPAVKPSELAEYTSGADVGISLIESICLSYYYSLPNKLFEYMNCGVPIIASNFPEMGAIVQSFDCGWTIEPTEHELEELIRGMRIEEIREKGAKALAASRHFGWESEEQKLFKAYQSALTS